MPEVKKRCALVIGGGFSGIAAARNLTSQFDVTLCDAKEFFEHTPGILRAFVLPEHFDALTFTYQHVLETHFGIKFLWGEVVSLDGDKRCAHIKPMFQNNAEEVYFDYCVIASGCHFGVFNAWGESLWFPTVHENARKDSEWPEIDERFKEGRRRHVLKEYEKLKAIDDKKGSILVAGAGFIGVELVTEIQYYFPCIKLYILDSLDKCLGPLPAQASDYCQKYMDKHGISSAYKLRYAPTEPNFFEKVGFPQNEKPDSTYVCIGVKAANFYVPDICLSNYDPLAPNKKESDLSKLGPGGGGWIRVNKKLQVLQKNSDGSESLFGHGRIFAIGDCNQVIGLPPIPKISYPGEEQAQHAAHNIKIIDHLQCEGPRVSSCCGFGPAAHELRDSWWPWGSGMYATSLGPKDGCFVMNAKWKPGTGFMPLRGRLASLLKSIIESTKINEFKGGFIGNLGWYFVHHTPFIN